MTDPTPTDRIAEIEKALSEPCRIMAGREYALELLPHARLGAMVVENHEVVFDWTQDACNCKECLLKLGKLNEIAAEAKRVKEQGGGSG